MSEETWHGIPRNKIPWYPTIDYEECLSCGKCVDYCKLGTYEFEEEDGKKIPLVKNPYNCVVLCTGCDSICPAGAISHPSQRETRETIKKLRKTYGLCRSKKLTASVLQNEKGLVCLCRERWQKPDGRGFRQKVCKR
jgi:NAD-dependent dihydropyrimidine dehydrogenase PreA subunit